MVIVLGYSPSAPGKAALARALLETAERNGRLVVVNSSRGDASVDKRFAQGEDADHLESTLRASGVEWELRQPVRGRDAAEEILAAAEATRADLIIIGLRHRTPVGKLIMGSTSQKVLLDSRCPVLSVKAAVRASPADPSLPMPHSGQWPHPKVGRSHPPDGGWTVNLTERVDTLIRRRGQ